MIEAKESLIGNINSKQNLSGNINVGEIVIPPTLQEKTTTPTTSSQTITYDENYNGLSSVTVNSIPQEYIIPSGEYNVTTNGTYNIKQYANVKVATNEADINWSTIGYNGTPKSYKSDYDYALEVKNNWTNDANLSYKFNGNSDLFIMPLVDTTNATNTNSMFSGCKNLRSVPKLVIENSTNMGYMFNNCNTLVDTDFTGFKTGNVSNMTYMFSNCYKLKELDLSTFTTQPYMSIASMFYGCTSLTKIDMRNFEFTKTNGHSSAFGATVYNGPANDCLIIVKNSAEKEWLNTKFSRLTNVQTVAEYEQ